MKQKRYAYYTIGGLLLLIIVGFIGYRLGCRSAIADVTEFYRTAPEMAYAIISEDIDVLTDAQLLSYLSRGLVLGLGQFSTDEIISRIEKPELKKLLKDQQVYLENFKKARSAVTAQYPDLLENQVR